MSETTKEENTGKKDYILNREIEDEMRQSYMEYAMSVIVGRALPDVRDGLKPVHRRVLYTMFETGLLHNKAYKKSANVVGNCMAKYHPHGDSAIYDTLVRMAQPFSLRYPLVQGQGNFGSVDGDGAAAMRYTEARLHKIAEEMLQDINKETVDMVDNFDGSVKEPSVLPAKIPNLLINGSSGIAVGMATNIPPHNLNEVCTAVNRIIDDPEIDTMQLSEIIKGPDFPTGATILGRNGIVNAYQSGRARIRIRSKTKIEERGGKQYIIVTEIPYQVNKSMLVEEIANCVKDKKVQGISDLRDESDKDGTRVVIQLKREINPDVVLNQLFSFTRLQVTYGINMVCLVDGQPKTLPIKSILESFITHRKEIIRRRTEYDLNKAKEKAHILEGLSIALKNIDAVIELIKKSKTADIAKNGLIENFRLTDKQAQAILEMRLQRLTGLEQEKIKKDLEETLALIKQLEEILASEKKILGIIKDEMNELIDKYGDNRRTEIEDVEDDDLEMEDLIEESDVVVTVTHEGYIKRLPMDTYRQQQRGGKGVVGATTRDEDFVEHIFIANTHKYLLFFTTSGIVHWLKVYQIPESGRTSKGKAVVNLLNLGPNEKITAFVPVKTFDKDRFLFLTTKKGIVKKTDLSAFARPRKGGIRAISLDSDDNLINAKLTDGKQHIIISSKKGMAVKFKESQVRPVGRSAQGVRGIKLRSGDYVVGMAIAHDENTLLTITENGYGKRTKIKEYRLTNRGGVGVISIQCSKRNGNVASVKSVKDTDEVMFISKKGIVIRTSAHHISVIGRNTQGVRLMRLGEGDAVVSSAKIITAQKQIEKIEEQKVEETTELKVKETKVEPTEDELDFVEKGNNGNEDTSEK